MDDVLKHPVIKAVAGTLINILGISFFFTALVMSTEVRGETTKANKPVTPAVSPPSYEEHRKECMRKRSEKRCDMLLDARKNLDDAKNAAVPTQ
jgi:hypothetical protein